MSKYNILLTVEVPDESTIEQVESWARFCAGYTGSLEENNPIYEQRGSDIEAISCHICKP